MSARRIDVCIVSYARPDLVARCLAAVREHLPEEQVLVWDNHSHASPAVRRLAEDHPDVDWTFSQRPVGFSAALNGLAAKTDENHDIMLLNPDAILTGPLLRTRAALAGSRVAAVSPTIVDPTGQDERWDVAHRRQNVLRVLVNRTGYAARLRGTPFSDLYPAPPDEVDGFITGACLLVSREAWRDVGPLDDRFYLYGDDSDWQRRARERGWRVLLVDEPEVRHGGESIASGKSPASQRAVDYLSANSALVLGGRGNRGPWTAVTGAELVLERVQRSRRRVRQAVGARLLAHAAGRHAVLLTVNTLDRGEVERRRVHLANELARRGHPVTLVCLQGLGPLQRELDDAVRIALRPWWQPVVDLVGDEAVLLTGTTTTEVAFASAWSRLGLWGSRRRWVVTVDDPAELGTSRPRWVRAAVRGSDRALAGPGGDTLSGAAVDGYQSAMAEVLRERG